MKIEYDGFVLNIEEITDYDTGKITNYNITCEQLPYFPQGLYKIDLESIITRFKLAVKSQIKADEKVMIKNNNPLKEDRDVILVRQFIEALDKVAKEMELLEEDEYSGTVLSVKLKRIYDEYKDRVIPSSSFDSFVDYYSYLQSKKEEEKREAAHKQYFNYLSNLHSENQKWLENKFNEVSTKYKDVLGFTAEDVKQHYSKI